MTGDVASTLDTGPGDTGEQYDDDGVEPAF